MINSFSEFITGWNFSGVQSIVYLFFLFLFFIGLIKFLLAKNLSLHSLKNITLSLLGYLLLAISLCGPLDYYSTEIFWAHMLQHIFIAMISIPILMLSNPLPILLWAFPKYIRYGIGISLNKTGYVRKLVVLLSKPKIALPMFIIILWGWHIPQAYNSSLFNEYIHFAMHFTMILSAIFFWWPILGPPPVRTSLSHPQKLLYLLIILTPNAALAAIITLSSSVIYTGYIDTPNHFGINAFDDQRIGGLLMWLPGNMIYLICITIIFFKWFFSEEKKFV